MSIEQMLCELDRKYSVLLNQFDDLNRKLEKGLIQSVEDNEFIDIKGVAELTGYAKQTIYDLKHKDEIPSFKVGRSLRFKSSEIRHWMLTRNQLNN